MRHSNKMFLSDSIQEYGSLCYHVQTPRESELEYHYHGISADCELRVSDCSNSVVLEFSFDDQASYEKRMRKINRMIGALDEMRAGMREAYQDIERLKSIKESQPRKPRSARRIIMDCDDDPALRVQRDEDEASSRRNFSEDSFLDPDEVAE